MLTLLIAWSAVGNSATPFSAPVREDTGGERVLVRWSDARSEDILVRVTFPWSRFQDDWPTPGTIYWRSLAQCTGAREQNVSIRTSVSTRSVRTWMWTTPAHLDSDLAAFNTMFFGPLTCRGGDSAWSYNAVLALLQEAPMFRMVSIVAPDLWPEGDARRSLFDPDLSRYLDPVEDEAFRDRIVRSRNAVITVVGNCDGTCAHLVTATLFPAPASIDAPAMRPIPPTENRSAPARIERWKDDQSRVGMVWQTPGTASPAWPAFVATSAVIHDRLMRRLRADSGLVYSVDDDYSASPWPDVWLVSAPVAPANAVAVREGMRDAMSSLRSAGVSAEDWEIVRAGLAAAAESDEPSSTLEAMEMEALSDGRWLDPRSGLHAAAALTVPQVNAFLSTFLDPARIHEVTLDASVDAPKTSPPDASPE